MPRGDDYKGYIQKWFIDMDFGDGAVFYILANAVSDLIILCTVIKISFAGLCYGLSFWTCVKMCAILVLSVMLILGFIRECECTQSHALTYYTYSNNCNIVLHRMLVIIIL